MEFFRNNTDAAIEAEIIDETLLTDAELAENQAKRTEKQGSVGGTALDGAGAAMMASRHGTVAGNTAETMTEGLGGVVAEGAGEMVAEGAGEVVAEGTGAAVAEGIGNLLGSLFDGL